METKTAIRNKTLGRATSLTVGAVPAGTPALETAPCAKLRELVKATKQARTAGDTVRGRELETELQKEQDDNHLQVFSTAPVDNVFATMQDRVAEIRRTTGVVRLLSKRDEKALNQFARAERVDLTDLLLPEFKLSERQMNRAHARIQGGGGTD